MRFRNFKYFIAQGFGNVFKNIHMSMASLSIVTMSIFIFSVFVLVGTNLSYFGQQIKSHCEIRVFVKDTLDRTRVLQIGGKCEKVQNVERVLFIPREDGLEVLKNKDPKLAAILDEDNPLRDEYRLTLVDVKLSDVVVQEISKIDGVDYVENDREFVGKLIGFASILKTLGICFAMFLALGAIFIISNTIRLTMFARRKEINIMKFLGATNGFISGSFIVEGVLIGLFGTLVPLFVLLIGYSNFAPILARFFVGIFQIKTVAQVVPILSISSISLGLGIGLSGSLISVRRYLHV